MDADGISHQHSGLLCNSSRSAESVEFLCTPFLDRWASLARRRAPMDRPVKAISYRPSAYLSPVYD